MASRELQEAGQDILDRENSRMQIILSALIAAKARADIEGPGTFSDLIEAALIAVKAIDNTAPNICLHCHLQQSLAVWACFHMNEELLKIRAQGWRPGEPGHLPETLVRATIAIAGLGQIAGEVAREADEALHANGTILSQLITKLLEAFGFGADTIIQSNPVEVVVPHPGSSSKH